MGRAWAVLLALPLAVWAQGQGRVSGSVADGATGQPLARAVVTLSTAEEPTMQAVAYTDARGAFVFSGLPAGKYTLAAQRNGYMHARYGAAAGENAAPEIISLEDGETRTGLRIRMRAYSSISGVVIGPDGDPIAQASVELLVPGFARGRPGYFRRRVAQTDAQGRYRLYNLLPGKYVVRASHRFAHARFIQAAGRPEASPEPPVYGGQYYSGADTLSGATPIVLGLGQQAGGIDFQLPLRQVVQLSGQAQVPPDAVGQPVQIQVFSQDGGAPTHPASMAFAQPPEYKFVLPNLEPGSYRLVAILSAPDRAWRGVQRIEVGGAPGQQVTVALESGIELAGRVKVEGEGPGPEPARVYLVPGDGLPSWPLPRADVGPDGRFRLKNVLPGIWDIGVEPMPKGGYIKAIRLGEQDVLTEDMEIDSSTAAPLNIVVSKRGGVVEGTVRNSAGEEAGVRAFVILAPEGRFAHVMSFFRMVQADGAGHFEILGVTPGTYRLYALDRSGRYGIQNPDFLEPYRARGVPLEVTEGSRVSKDVRLIVTERRD